MTVTSELSSVVYETDGVSVAFVVPFRFLHASHLRVIETRDGNETVLSPGAHYSVTGVNAESGGTVTLHAAPPVGGKIVIVRDVPITQETHYPKNDPFPERAHEQALDKLTMIAQQLAEGLGRTIKLPADGSTTSEAFVDSLFQAQADAIASAQSAAASQASATASEVAAHASAISAANADISASTAASSALNTLEAIALLTAGISGSVNVFFTDNGFDTVYQAEGFDMGGVTLAVPFFNEAIAHKASLSIGSGAFDLGSLA